MKGDVTESWNRFAWFMIEAERAWKEHQEKFLEVSSRDIEELPLSFQEFLSKSWSRSKFDVMIPRLVDYTRASGGLERMFIETEEVVEEVEVEEPTVVVATVDSTVNTRYDVEDTILYRKFETIKGE